MCHNGDERLYCSVATELSCHGRLCGGGNDRQGCQMKADKHVQSFSVMLDVPLSLEQIIAEPDTTCSIEMVGVPAGAKQLDCFIYVQVLDTGMEPSR